ncbi:MAG: MFS transporter [Candidatus Dormiibacterota bacterium]
MRRPGNPTAAAGRAARITFASLALPNYRRYFTGQSISLIGTWMQTTAQAWLVLTLTRSSVDLGVIVALQALPVLLLGAYGGVVADRVDKRRLMIVLQSLMGLQALVLGILVTTHAVRVWEVGLLALILGLNNTFENPARQAFILEMVGSRDLRNAVSLNSVLANVARAIGPAIAGLLIASVGDGVCFLLNAASFVAVVVSLATMDRSALQPSLPSGRKRGQLREGLRYVSRVPELGVPLLMMLLIGTFAYEFQVVLPVLAKQTFHGGATVYGFMTASMGIGAVAGGLVTAARGHTGLRPVALAASAFGVVLFLAAGAPLLFLEYLALAAVGWASVSFIARGNSTLQLSAAPSMRGRVMALWAIAFQGTTPVGGPLIGLVVAGAGARAGLLSGAISCVAAAAVAGVFMRRLHQRGDGAVAEGDVADDGDTELPALDLD